MGLADWPLRHFALDDVTGAARNLPKKAMPAAEAVRNYKALAQVERAFR